MTVTILLQFICKLLSSDSSSSIAADSIPAPAAAWSGVSPSEEGSRAEGEAPRDRNRMAILKGNDSLARIFH